jgi:deoxycytidylate deaminase
METMDEVWMKEAAQTAQKALCLKSKCGVVIVKDGKIIGRGYNAPPLDDITARTCLEDVSNVGKEKYDKTCCLHAEWRAIMDALAHHSDKVEGADLYFVRVDDQGHIKKSGNPYCTVCSRLALDVGLARFALWHEAGIKCYDTKLYNHLSAHYVG